MRDEVMSSGGTLDPATAGSSAGGSSPTIPTNVGSIDGSTHGHGSKAGSLSYFGSQPPWTSLSTSAGGSSLGSSRPSCRPWERGDLLRRLSTFKPSNWFGKPKVASSLACAQRGWTNVDVDKIACESCDASLSFVLLLTWTPVEIDHAGEAFSSQLNAGHKVNCPWKGNSCPDSLVQFPPMPQSSLVGGYEDRCDGLLQFESLSVIAASAVEQMRVSHGPQFERFLSQPPSFMSGELDLKSDSALEVESSQGVAVRLYSRAQKLISLCGWEPRWLPNVQDCEVHSAQSARNGCSFAPTKARGHSFLEPGPSKELSASAKKDNGKGKLFSLESRYERGSPLLECALCGATVRIWDFCTVPRPALFAPNNIDIPDSSKRMELTRGASAASGINCWADDAEKEQIEDREEVATTAEGKSFLNPDVDLNLTMAGAGGSSTAQLGRTTIFRNIHDADIGRDLVIGQPSGSEIGDRATSYESRGPSTHKRNLEIDGSSDDRPLIRMHQADSMEGAVIDRDGDEVTDVRQYSAGPSKRARDSDIFDTYCSSYKRDSDAGPSHSKGLEVYADANRVTPYRQESEQNIGIASTRDSARASSVIAMYTGCHDADDDSMESVENYPGDIDDAHFPSSICGNLDMNDMSELNYSNHAQLSICFQSGAEAPPGEMGVSSTNDGEEIFNAENVTPQLRNGFSLGISGGSFGMCASHEAEIHGVDASVHRADSVVGDMEPRVEDADHQCQTGESAPDPVLTSEIIPAKVARAVPQVDSVEMSQSVGRADSGSKIDDSTKAESVESGERSQSHKSVQDNSAHPSLSYNAILYSGCATSKDITGAGKGSFIKDCAFLESVHAATRIGPPKRENNYEEASEFDPIIHHNKFCPWVNGNVAAAGSIQQCGYGTSADAIALCGWQLTLNALDASQSTGHFPHQTLQSESAASLHKDDNQTPAQKLLRHHSVSRRQKYHCE